MRVLNVVAESLPNVQLEINSYLLGGAAIDATGKPLPEETLAACKAADAVLMGMLSDLCLLSYMVPDFGLARDVIRLGWWT